MHVPFGRRNQHVSDEVSRVVELGSVVPRAPVDDALRCPLHNRLLRVPVERRRPRQHHEQNHAESPNVALVVVCHAGIQDLPNACTRVVIGRTFQQIHSRIINENRS